MTWEIAARIWSTTIRAFSGDWDIMTKHAIIITAGSIYRLLASVSIRYSIDQCMHVIATCKLIMHCKKRRVDFTQKFACFICNYSHTFLCVIFTRFWISRKLHVNITLIIQVIITHIASWYHIKNSTGILLYIVCVHVQSTTQYYTSSNLLFHDWWMSDHCWCSHAPV